MTDESTPKIPQPPDLAMAYIHVRDVAHNTQNGHILQLAMALELLITEVRTLQQQLDALTGDDR